SSFSIEGAIPFLVKASVFIASSTRRPLIRSNTSRAFCGETRWKRASARNSCSAKFMFFSPLLRRCWGRRRLGRSLSCRSLHRVTFKVARLTEFTELMSDHVLGDVHGNELAAVVHGDRVSDHIGVDRRAARPGTHNLLVVGAVHRFDLDHQVLVDERALLCASRHKTLFPSAAQNEFVGPLVVARLVTASRLSPRSHWVTSPGGLSFTTAVRMVDWIHRHTAVYWTTSQPSLTTSLADRDVLMIGIPDLAHRRHAIDKHLTCLARRQLQRCVIAFFRDKLCGAAS